MISTLGYALLGLIAREPTTGYDLARQLRRPVGYFWSARHSQIYPELARLEGAALLRHVVIDGAGPRPTKQYSITGTGRREVRSWLLSTSADVDEREVLLRAYLLFVLTPDEAAGVMRAIRSHHVQVLDHYLLIGSGAEPQVWGPAATERATLDWGVAFERGRITWCDGLLAHLEGWRRDDHPSPRGRP
ncbi:MAG: PadR family transcriptional regulator [Lapillicoccus sp.]